MRTGAATYNGEEAVLGAALMLAGENSRIVAKRVDERSSRKSRQNSRRAWKSSRSMTARCWWTAPFARSKRILFEGAILVVVVLLLLLGNWRAALIVASAIPLSLLFAMTGMVQGRDSPAI